MNSINNQLIIYTTSWCGDCVRTKKLLDDLGVSYKEINIENDPDAAERVVNINGGNRSVPTIVFPDESHLTEPDNDTLKKKLMSLDII